MSLYVEIAMPESEEVDTAATLATVLDHLLERAGVINGHTLLSWAAGHA